MRKSNTISPRRPSFVRENRARHAAGATNILAGLLEVDEHEDAEWLSDQPDDSASVFADPLESTIDERLALGDDPFL